ncbi:hypothetical protein CEP52_011835 [Fusarium oligoseptatum]|uniref:Uncharacterized protein n=1 Tax=Fusarium oligoseptatum TaxID=2604345 RepID=A0A428T1A9_9HYPO|nr:hypothetical protein CEP52_011835 [Fusarium oligoseptatum]
MHLDHKIPWKTAATHFNLVPSNTEGRFDLVALNPPSQASTLGHFSRVFSATIKEFSETELSKVPSVSPSVSPSAKLFSDDVLVFAERHFWPWTTRDQLGFAQPVMLVMIAAVAPEKSLRIEALATLLRLASEIPLSQLRNVHWGHAFGVDLVAGVALQVYVLLNLTEAVQCRQKEQTSLLNVDPLMSFLDGHALRNYDYPAQNIPHRAFWSSIGVSDLGTDTGNESAVVDPLAQDDDEIHREARNGLRQYLKDCFAILYVYDVVLRQACGSDEAEEFWAEKITAVFWMLGCKRGDD